MTTEKSSRLFYRGTTIEVRLGDHVTFKRLLRSPQKGVVCYLPGVNTPHPEMRDSDGSQDWAIELEDGRLLAWPYVPDQLQPSSRIRFVGRGRSDYPGLDPDKDLGLVPDPD